MQFFGSLISKKTKTHSSIVTVYKDIENYSNDRNKEQRIAAEVVQQIGPELLAGEKKDNKEQIWTNLRIVIIPKEVDQRVGSSKSIDKFILHEYVLKFIILRGIISIYLCDC